MKSKAQKYFLELIREEKKGILPGLIRGVLFLLSLPYRMISNLRNRAYDKDWFKQYQPPIPVVVSIGNIVAGGTGKTPVVLLVAKEFIDKFRVGILSRGYRSPAEKQPSPVALSSGKGPLHSAAYCGDEPFLLSENLPEAYIFVGKDRHKSANMAAKAGVEILFLDDGMQHRSIGRDYDIVVVDASDPFGQQHFLPRGLLRESPKNLSRAHLIIVNRVESEAEFFHALDWIRRYANCPVVGTAFVAEKVYDLQGNDVGTIQGKKVGAFCGIGQPERFFTTIESLEATIVGKESFIDHAPYHFEQIVKLAEAYKAKGAEMLICTEKDKVKIPEIPGLSLPILWLKMKLQVVHNKEAWQRFLDQVHLDLKNRTFEDMLK